MDARFPISRDDLYSLQMEVKQVQYTQSNHAERLSRLEKRSADDSALKSVWNSPFPGILGGTPHQGPVQTSHNDGFDDLDVQGEQLLGSLHLGPAEEEPVRRGAASRANSVRFDESALHGSSWGGQSNRHSGDFGPLRPGSGLMMERTLSHKSDGRHSSAGHSVHSHLSVASGRASSLGLDTNCAGGDDDSSSFEIPGPPVSLYVLGTVPSIVRCWLTTNFAHGTLLYADVCTGSQKSIVDSSLLKELDLLGEVQRDSDGVDRIRLDVYLAEAVVTRHENPNGSSTGGVPSMAVAFEVTGNEHSSTISDRKGIRIYIGSDALRAHSADIFFSQNTMVLYGNEQERLRVPFVRPEDENTFKYIYTTSIAPGKPKLNANATPFVLGDSRTLNNSRTGASSPGTQHEKAAPSQPISCHGSDIESRKSEEQQAASEHGGDGDNHGREASYSETSGKDGTNASEVSRRETSSTSTGIWGSWRQGAGAGADGAQRETGLLSGYQPAGRSGRNMKVLKPVKSSSSSARTGTSYEPPLPPRSSTESRRKSQASLNCDGGGGVSIANRWDVRRSVSSGAELKAESSSREYQKGATLPRSANPVGVGSAFSWMTPATKASKTSSTGG
ncbi:ubiquitin carboxyl-terminal hydrolase 19 [Metarhizium album ARSEF 1941]|uniref:Ubiquitin carboxyl-terminal hydrolase 19 n=1 Tax=Metarhizium album (strain ARSEF 1941) TaxID=1081103 RepID=A0A0B2X1H7_METAS|nr:ubiquitin carboxyl-terminal hydrolase 19 [Metarhizium album ARSEF 1941]KHN99532.1 ubiquitin carboxyl-terminal hydrolase 19 [Metarhizium album ARSEF 1941]